MVLSGINLIIFYMRYIFLALLLLWTNVGCAAQVLVVVGGTAITSIDVDKRIEALKLANPSIVANDLYRKYILNELINEELFLNEASRLKISVSPEEVNAHFKDLQKRYNFSDAQSYIFSSNESLRKQVANQLLWNKLVGAVFYNKIKVSDAEVRDEQKIKTNEVKEVTFKQIIFTNSDIEKVKKLTATNCNDLDIATQEAGLGRPYKNTLLLSDLNPDLQSLIKTLPVNKLSDILNFQNQKQIIMICNKNTISNNISLHDIAQELSNRKINAEAQKYLSELRKRICVDYVAN